MDNHSNFQLGYEQKPPFKIDLYVNAFCFGMNGWCVSDRGSWKYSQRGGRVFVLAGVWPFPQEYEAVCWSSGFGLQIGEEVSFRRLEHY